MSDSNCGVHEVGGHAVVSDDETGRRISAVASGLIGSEILAIAAEIREQVQAGTDICNLTVGDFEPSQFPIPPELSRSIRVALEAGETNYPPSNGILALREAVRDLYASELGLHYPLESVLIAGGARPCIYGTYRAVVDPGDTVVYPVPSWNNNHYCHMLGARAVQIPCSAESGFMPTRQDLDESLSSARLVCLNTPLNPTGTMISEPSLQGICEAIVDENRRRAVAGERPVYLMYDHIYWMLCHGKSRHITPPALVPEMAKYTVFVDGISKAFAATGLRVGWAVGPTDVIERMQSLLGHVGAWAPRAEQVASVGLLRDKNARTRYLAGFIGAIQARLKALHQGFLRMSLRGLPVATIAPEGGIYLTVQISALGYRTPEGARLGTNDDVRRYLLDRARVGIVPFQAFGIHAESGWFRLSVGAASMEAIAAALPRIDQALSQLKRAD